MMVSSEFKQGLLAGAVASLLLCGLFHLWQVSKIELAMEEEMRKEAEAYNLESKALRDSAHEKDIQHQAQVTDLNTKYSRANSELERLRVENAALKRSRSAAASGQCDRAIERRDDLLLRMADLGLRTARAADEKQAALKNCVGNYGRITAR